MMSEEEINAQTIWNLPKCEYCFKVPEPKSCMVMWAGKPCCGLCVFKLHQWQQNESARIMAEIVRGD